jgi:arylsulfatase A-like enzyme
LDTGNLDGKSLMPIIEDNAKKTMHPDFCWANSRSWAARKGDWKLLHNPAIRHEEFAPEDSIFLVNLKEDPGEMTNLATQYPKKVEELKAQFEVWLERSKN